MITIMVKIMVGFSVDLLVEFGWGSQKTGSELENMRIDPLKVERCEGGTT
jgi:hypothetical protein